MPRRYPNASVHIVRERQRHWPILPDLSTIAHRSGPAGVAVRCSPRFVTNRVFTTGGWHIRCLTVSGVGGRSLVP